MKLFSLKAIALSVLLAFFINPGILFPQIQHGGQPIARHVSLEINELKANQSILQLSQQQLIAKEYYQNRETKPGEAMHAGFGIETSITPLSHGSWKNHGDSVMVWQKMITSSGARGVGLILEDFYLSENAKIFIYDPSLNHVVGSFTHKNNNQHQLLSTQLIPGDQLIIEYIETIGNPEIFFNSSFMISSIIHVSQGVADINDDKSLGNAEWCHVDVNCSEGAMWQRQKRGVARMLMRVGNSWFWCSGSLINNTRQDGTPFFLSAAHCGDNATMDDMLAWQFYFNFERPECFGSGFPAHNVIIGASLLSDGPLLQGSDFRLLRLEHKPPLAWRPYYNGWNRLDEPANSGVGIHHPAGDAKKISTYNQTATSANPIVSGNQMAENSAWRVNWKETDNGFGVTQGGSSGSPLFNQDGLIVGTLTGGSSNCNNTSNPDFYGKLSYHWDQNGDYFYEQVKTFLDPFDSGISQLPGYDPVVSRFPTPGFVSASPTGEGHVLVEWTKPGQTPNKPGWYSYSNEYSGYVWEGPERATIFTEGHFDFSFPFQIKKLSHVFIEPEGSPWPDNRFIFKIYNHDGVMLLYESPVLHAENLVEVVHELPQTLVVHDQFYVVVRPLHNSGRPSSAFKTINHGNGVSFYGTPHNWNVSGNPNNQFAYLTKIFIQDFENKSTEIKSFSASPENNTPINKQHSESYHLYSDDNDKWENSVATYNIYKNNELVYSLNTDETYVFSFVDDTPPTGNDFDTYYVTAVYQPEGVESAPSNVAWLYHKALCDINVTEFPYTEVFEDIEIPDCWTESSTGSGWQLADQFTAMDNTIEALEGEHFIYVIRDDQEETTYNWLISPPFDISAIENPALSFWFNANHTTLKSDLLSLYLMTGNSALVKIWDAGQHPEYTLLNEFTWTRTVKDLSRYQASGFRIAFLLEGQEAAFAAIDNIEILDATEHLYPLSLDVEPQYKGEVFGAGSYIGGQKVSVYAEPNAGFYFHHWLHGSEVISDHQRYAFIMPENVHELTAFFDTQAPPQSNEQGISSTAGIKAFPNPNSGHFYLHFADNKQDVTIEVVNATGKSILRETHDSITAYEQLEFNLSQYPNGTYFVIVSSERKRETLTISIAK